MMDVECLVERETSGGNHQKTYANTFARNLRQSVKQIIDQTRHFAGWWEPEDLRVPIERKAERLEKKR